MLKSAKTVGKPLTLICLGGSAFLFQLLVDVDGSCVNKVGKCYYINKILCNLTEPEWLR